jgi:hypothetical protein
VAIEDHETDFHRVHRERFGFDRDGEIEVLEVRLTVEEAAPPRTLRIPALARERVPVRAWFDGAYRELSVGPMDDAREARGPALLFGNGTTVVVDRGWIADARSGFLLLRRVEPTRTALGTDFHPVHTAVFATRVAAIAEQMGERLRASRDRRASASGATSRARSSIAKRTSAPTRRTCRSTWARWARRCAA